MPLSLGGGGAPPEAVGVSLTTFGWHDTFAGGTRVVKTR